MSRSIAMVLLCALGALPLMSAEAVAGPARPDPTQMSGIPRPDPQIPAGEITVRVLRGSFDAPALDAVVELELRSSDGRQVELRSMEAGNQGRVHFRELDSFAGGQAVARVVLDGETIRSRQIDIGSQTGTAVMLVSGGPAPDPAQQMSLPGIAFDFENAPVGTLMVGAFDMVERKGLQGANVELVVTTPDGRSDIRKQTAGEAGQALFKGLEALPEGAILQVQAQLDDGEPHRSARFSPSTTSGQAVVLARGRGAAAKSAGAEGAGKRAEMKLPPPRVAKDLPVGTVQVVVVDGSNQPVADQLVTLVRKDFAGTEKRFEVRTNEQGLATESNLPLATNDGLYYAGVSYDGGPYTSAFFGLDKRGGVRVVMRVWEITQDSSVARSAVQWEVIEGENNHAQVVQIYEVVVGGDKAFWPDEELLIEGMPGAKSMVVLRGAEDWLNHDEGAPFATLAHPIPPGTVATLSVGYVIEHDGELEFDWEAPFDIVESAIVLSDAHTLDASGAKVEDRQLPAQAGLDYRRVPYDLGQKGAGAIQFRVSGLRRTNQIFTQLGAGIAGLMGLVLLLGLMLRPRRDPRARLILRRDELLAALSNRRTPKQRQRVIAALDRVYRQIDAIDSAAKEPRPAAPAKA